MTQHFALPPFGRRPVPRIEEPEARDSAGQADRPSPGASGTAAVRLLIGSHLLLLIQSLLILCSGIELGAARIAIAGVSGISLAALVWAAFGRFAGRRRNSAPMSGRHRDA